jgi:hypothetical protein
MKNRPERQISFLVVWLTMFSCFCAQAQVFYPETQKTGFLQPHYPGFRNDLGGEQSLFLNKKKSEKGPGLSVFPLTLAGAGYKTWAESSYTQPSDLYYIQSGFFCKKEWELEKATRIPIRIRLGSLDDCNALEGKH